MGWTSNHQALAVVLLLHLFFLSGGITIVLDDTEEFKESYNGAVYVIFDYE